MLVRIFLKLGFFLMIIVPQLAIAQIASPGVPLSLINKLEAIPASIELPQEALEAGRQKVVKVEGLKPFLFAIPVDTSISVPDLGNWTDLPDGSRICRLGVKSDGAFSLNIIFDEYNLPPGVKLFIYNPGFETVRGAFTHINNKTSGKLATTPVPGDEIIVELNLPPGRIDYQPELIIGRIGHDIKDPFGFKSGYRASGACNVDINCPEGDEWQIEKNSVAKFIRGSVWLCSGALINNTANDGRPLMLTANHCIGSDRHAETSIFYFNYESPTCNGANGRLDHSISTCTLISTTTKLDFSLIELSVVPPPAFEPYYAGWNRTPNSFFENVVCIHHPSGDVKKISKRYGRVITGNFGSGFDVNTHWLIQRWDLGTTEGGSSGSPLFDQDHRIIGDLTGGDASCSYNFNDYFQKFHVCWDKYPDPDDQLKVWLDPLEEDVLIWNGYDPYASGRPVANFEFMPNPPQVDKEVRLVDKSEGQPTSWAWYFENGNPSYTTDHFPVVKFTTSGPAAVKLIVENSNGKDSVQQTIYVEDFMAFKADQNRIVAGAVINFTDISSGEPVSHFWTFEGGDPETWTGPEPLKIEYDQAGTYDVTLYIEYPELTDTLYYRDFIKVEPENLMYSGDGMSSLGSEEASQSFKLTEQDWIAGNNSLDIEAFANAFSPNMDTVRVATGVRIPISILPGSVTGTYLTAAIWDESFNELARDSVELINEPFPDNQTIWFNHPVGIDSLVYAGFIVPENQTGIFCSDIATPREQGKEGAAYARRNGSWESLLEGTGLISDLAVTLETGYVFPNYKSQIKLTPKITSDRIYLDLSNLVFEKFDVQLYDVLGRQVFSNYSLRDKYLELEFLEPVSGMYLMRFQLDELSFTKKILVVGER